MAKSKRKRKKELQEKKEARQVFIAIGVIAAILLILTYVFFIVNS